MPSPKFRHTVEKSDNLVRVTLPTKKDVIRILWFCLWMFLWGYIVYGFMLIIVAYNRAIEIGKSSTPPSQPGGLFIYVSIAFLLFFLAWLALGAFAIHRFIWFIGGKEVIEATPQTLTVIKQSFRWKKSKEYSSEKVSNLRTNTKPLSIFVPGKRVKNPFGGAGLIAFDYGGRTSAFGLEISMAEAEQIILALREVLPQQNAG
jgi:hypothetical protein